MAVLVHEVWEEVSGGMVLHGCCLADPLGADFRQHLEAGARLLTTFEAGSHFEAMTIYYRYLGRGAYTTHEPWDYQPYPDEWLTEQRSQA
jgi:hypothetical protein